MADYAISVDTTALLKALTDVRTRQDAVTAAVQKYGKEGSKAYTLAEREAKKAAKAQDAFIQGIGAGLVGGVTAGVAALDTMAASIDDLYDAAARAAIAPRTMEALSEAAKAGGADLQTAANAAEFFERQVVKAATGTEKAAQGFKTLGVELTDANGALRPTDDILREVLKKIAALPNDTDKAAAAVEVFGRQAGPLLESGLLASDDALKAFQARVDTFGITSAPRAADAAVLWQNAMAELKQTITGTGASLFAEFGPKATTVLHDFSAGIVTVREIGLTPLNIALQSSVTAAKDAMAALTAIGKATTHPIDAYKEFTAALDANHAELKQFNATAQQELSDSIKRINAWENQSAAIDAATTSEEKGTAAAKAGRLAFEDEAAARKEAAKAAKEQEQAAKDERKAMDDRVERSRAEVAERLRTAQDLHDKEIALFKDEYEYQKQLREKNEKEAEEAAKKQIKAYNDIADAASQLASAATSYFGTLLDDQLDTIDDLEKTIEEAHDSGDKNAEKSAKKRLASEKEAAEKAFSAQQVAAVGEATVDYLKGLVSAAALGPIAGPIMATALTATYGASLAGIEAQQLSFDDGATAPQGTGQRQMVSAAADDYHVFAKTQTGLLQQMVGLMTNSTGAPQRPGLRPVAGDILRYNPVQILGRDLPRIVRGGIVMR